MFKLANKTALVTGASRSTGGAAALVLAVAGARDRAFTSRSWPELTQADGAGLSGEVVAQDVGDKRRESYGRRQLVDRRRDQDRSQDGCTCSNEDGRIHDLQVRANWR